MLLRHGLLSVGILASIGAGEVCAQRIPQVVSSGRTRVLVSVFDGANLEAEQRILSSAVSACRRRFPVSGADSAAFVSVPAPSFDVSPRAGEAFVVLTILPEDRTASLCDLPEDAELVALLRGTSITADSAAPADRTIEKVAITRDSVAVDVRSALVRPLRRIGPSGLAPPTLRWHRLLIEISSLETQLAIGASPLVVEVSMERGGARDRVVIPSRVIERAWRSAAAERSARLLRTGSPPMAFAMPSDSMLALAMTEYTEGRLGSAAALATRRIDEPGLGRGDRRLGFAMAGTAMLALDDSIAGTLVLKALLQFEPCFLFDDGAPEMMSALLAALPRPRARCTAMSSGRTALRASLMPGFARPLDGRSAVDRSRVGVLLVGTTIAGLALQSSARTLYDEYLAYEVTMSERDQVSRFTMLFDRAENARRSGRVVWAAGALVYGAQIVHTVWLERQFANRLDQVRGGGEPRRLRVTPWSDGKGLGLMASFQ